MRAVPAHVQRQERSFADRRRITDFGGKPPVAPGRLNDASAPRAEMDRCRRLKIQISIQITYPPLTLSEIPMFRPQIPDLPIYNTVV